MTLTITVTHVGDNTFDTQSVLGGVGDRPTPAEMIALVQELEDVRRIIGEKLGGAIQGAVAGVCKLKQQTKGAVN